MYEPVSQASYTSLSFYTLQPLPLALQIPNSQQSLSYDYSAPNPPPNYATFQPQPSFYPHPNPISPAVQPLTNEAMATASHGTSLNNNLVGQMGLGKLLKRNKPKVISSRTSMSQTVWCNLCKIECNSIREYEKHVSGKKHNKTIKNIYASTIVSAQESSQSGNNTTGSGTSVGEGKPVVPSVLSDLESKKQKLLEGGTSAQCLRVCAICNVACNGQIAFSAHLVGKKHIAQERALNAKENTGPTNSEANLTKKTNVPVAAWCEICKISCTSIEGLAIHRVGKKHKKNVEKLRYSISDMTDPSSSLEQVVPATMPTEVVFNAETIQGTVSEPEVVKKIGARSMEPMELEAKKRKVLESGAAADAVRMCTVCNMVCNSDLVFSAHLAGQKHASMMKRAAAVVTPNSQLVTSQLLHENPYLQSATSVLPRL